MNKTECQIPERCQEVPSFKIQTHPPTSLECHICKIGQYQHRTFASVWQKSKRIEASNWPWPQLRHVKEMQIANCLDSGL